MANIIEADEKLEVGWTLPVIPEGPVTRESLEAEAIALGDKFSFVSIHSADMIADAEEMLAGQSTDLPEFRDRGYPVTSYHFDRLALLNEIMAPAKTEGDVTNESGKTQTADANAKIDVLLDNRRFFDRVGRAAGLPATLFALETKNSRRINVVTMRMEEVVANVERFLSRLPDKAKVVERLESTRTIISAQKKARRQAKLLRTQRTLDTLRAEQYERLLLNILLYMSAQGQAAFEGDKGREARYALDHSYGKRSVVERVEEEAETDAA